MKKDMKKIIAPVGIVAVALVCVLGGTAWVNHVEAAEQQRIQAELKARDEQLAMESQKAVEELPAPSFQLAIPAPTPKPVTATSAPSYAPANETVTVEENGDVTIIPDFEHQKDGATKIQVPGTQVTTNLGGSGGGELPIGEDGAYHGDNPATPKPVQEPQEPQTTTAPVDTPPAATPDPGPSDGQGSGDNGPPSYTGKNGEISSDGKYMWGDGFGWVQMQTGVDVGQGGQIDDSDRYAPGTGLTGNKVGSM